MNLSLILLLYFILFAVAYAKKNRQVYYAIITLLIIVLFISVILLCCDIQVFIDLFKFILSDKELFEDIIKGIFGLFFILFSLDKERIDGSGSDYGSENKFSSSIYDSSEKEDKNTTIEEAGPSKLDKGKRKATEEESYELEKKRSRMDPPWDPIKAQEELIKEIELEKSLNSEELERKRNEQAKLKEQENQLGMEGKKELTDEEYAFSLQRQFYLEYENFLKEEKKNNSDSGSLCSSSSSNLSSLNSKDEGERLERKLEVKRIEESLPKRPKD